MWYNSLIMAKPSGKPINSSSRPKTRASAVKKGKTDVKRQPLLTGSSSVSGIEAPSVPSSSPGVRPNWIAQNPRLYQKFSTKQKAWLRHYPECCSVRMTAKKSGVSITSYYEWMHDEQRPNFRLAMESVKEMANQTLEDAMHERAIHGVDEPIFYRDEQIGVKTHFSDGLALALAKANMPEKYNKPREISGPDGGAIPLSLEVLDSLLGDD